MLNTVSDIFDEQVYVGDTVIASRPSGNGSSRVDYCKVNKINPKSVSLEVIDREGNELPPPRWGSNKFTLQKNRNSDRCEKIVRHRE
jgi:hypothetical protein